MPARRLSAEWEDDAWRDATAEEGLGRLDPDLAGILERSLAGTPPRVAEIERLFRSRGHEVEAVAKVADDLRRRRNGDRVTYVVNRNINYTNQCYFRCGFCGFSRGPKSMNLRGDPYILEVHEVVHRSVEAWERGATEVCLQGGIHPDFTGDFYAGVLPPSSSGCRRCTSTASRRWRCGRAPTPSVITVRGVPHPPPRRRPGDAAGDGGGDPRRPASGSICAPTRSAPPSGRR